MREKGGRVLFAASRGREAFLLHWYRMVVSPRLMLENKDGLALDGIQHAVLYVESTRGPLEDNSNVDFVI